MFIKNLNLGWGKLLEKRIFMTKWTLLSFKLVLTFPLQHVSISNDS